MEIPVGSRWEIVDKKQGRTGYIYLQKRDTVGHSILEVWIAGWYYTLDHSAPYNASDWYTNYRTARYWLPVNGKAKRVK